MTIINLRIRLYTMNTDKTNPKYLRNPVGHLMALRSFREKLEVRILGEEDPEWRSELEFVLSRTLDKIREVQAKVL